MMGAMSAAADFSASEFLPGLQLARRFYHEAVAPMLAQNWPDLRYSAALIGDGSEVLGFDGPRSTDHDCGPRLYLFLAPEDFSLAAEICSALDAALPADFAGFSVVFADHDRCQGFSDAADVSASLRPRTQSAGARVCMRGRLFPNLLLRSGGWIRERAFYKPASSPALGARV